MCNCNYCNDTEDENSFWADVYYQMEVNKCDKETSINAVTEIHREMYTFNVTVLYRSTGNIPIFCSLVRN